MTDKWGEAAADPARQRRLGRETDERSAPVAERPARWTTSGIATAMAFSGSDGPDWARGTRAALVGFSSALRPSSPGMRWGSSGLTTVRDVAGSLEEIAELLDSCRDRIDPVLEGTARAAALLGESAILADAVAAAGHRLHAAADAVRAVRADFSSG